VVLALIAGKDPVFRFPVAMPRQEFDWPAALPEGSILDDSELGEGRIGHQAGPIVCLKILQVTLLWCNRAVRSD